MPAFDEAAAAWARSAARQSPARLLFTRGASGRIDGFWLDNLVRIARQPPAGG